MSGGRGAGLVLAGVFGPVPQPVERKVGPDLLGDGLHPVPELDPDRIGDPDHALEVGRNRGGVGDPGIAHLGAECFSGVREPRVAAIDDG